MPLPYISTNNSLVNLHNLSTYFIEIYFLKVTNGMCHNISSFFLSFDFARYTTSIAIADASLLSETQCSINSELKRLENK